MSTPHPESESRSKATNAPPVIESVLPLSDDTRLASGTNGPRRVGELLGTVIADLKQKSLRHQKQTNKLHGGVFDQQPDLTWHATEQEWREFNEWAQSRMAVTEAASHGLWLDPETGELTKIEKEQIAEEHPPIVKAAAKVPEDGRNAGDEPLPEDRGDFMAWADKRDRLFREQYPPMPEDYGIEEEPAESDCRNKSRRLICPYRKIQLQNKRKPIHRQNSQRHRSLLSKYGSLFKTALPARCSTQSRLSVRKSLLRPCRAYRTGRF